MTYNDSKDHLESQVESRARVLQVRQLTPGSRIHISGICGTGMAQVATLLKNLGFHVVGSDKAFYPPMDKVVRSVADQIFEGYSADNFAVRPDFVVIGNSIRSDNPEAVYTREHNIPYAAMPEVFQALLIGDRDFCPTSVVVTGTHGKTTTSAMMSWILECCGRRPGYFIGGAAGNFAHAIRAVNTDISIEQRVVVLEGDEYDSAYFLKRPKFLSYRPDIVILTSIEFDHADIYSSLSEIEEQFRQLVEILPESGHLLVADNPKLVALVKSWLAEKQIKATVTYYGELPDSQARLVKRRPREDGQQELTISINTININEVELSVTTDLSGKHNAYNILACLHVGSLLGLDFSAMKQAIATFSGVKKRQTEILKTEYLRVIEDFAHHPTAIKTTLAGLREKYRPERLIAVYEPRSNTGRRNFFQDDYVECFSSADHVIIKNVNDAGDYTKGQEQIKPLDVPLLVSNLQQHVTSAHSRDTVEEILSCITDILSEHRSDKCLLVIMSNGDFGGLTLQVLERFRNHSVD